MMDNESIDDYSYYHNSWDYLMPAILKIKGECKISSFESAYNDLVETCREITKDLPKTVWFLENNEGDFLISKDYDKKNETLLITKNRSEAISFPLKITADKFYYSIEAPAMITDRFKPKEYIIS